MRECARLRESSLGFVCTLVHDEIFTGISADLIIAYNKEHILDLLWRLVGVYVRKRSEAEPLRFHLTFFLENSLYVEVAGGGPRDEQRRAVLEPRAEPEPAAVAEASEERRLDKDLIFRDSVNLVSTEGM